MWLQLQKAHKKFNAVTDMDMYISLFISSDEIEELSFICLVECTKMVLQVYIKVSIRKSFSESAMQLTARIMRG